MQAEVEKRRIVSTPWEGGKGGGGACEMSTGRAGRMGDAEGLGGVVGGGVRNMETESEEMRRGVKKDTNRENG